MSWPIWSDSFSAVFAPERPSYILILVWVFFFPECLFIQKCRTRVSCFKLICGFLYPNNWGIDSHYWMNISRWWLQIFYFHPYLGKIPILTILRQYNIFQKGWNHQPDILPKVVLLAVVVQVPWISCRFGFMRTSKAWLAGRMDGGPSKQGSHRHGWSTENNQTWNP